MRQAFLLSFLLLLLLPGCRQTAEVKKPEGVLSEKKLVPLMWDLLQAEEVSAVTLRPDSAAYSVQRSLPMYGGVLQRHGVDQAALGRSLDWYRRHPEVFSVVIDSLQRRASYATAQRDSLPAE